MSGCLTRRDLLLRLSVVAVVLRANSPLPTSATLAGDEDFVVVNGWILKASEVKAAR